MTQEYKDIQKKLAKALQQKIGVPIDYRYISHMPIQATDKPGYIRMDGNTISVGFGHGDNYKNIVADTNFTPFVKHLKALHKLTGIDHPSVLHSAAAAAAYNDRHNPGKPHDYKKLRELQIKKQISDNPEISKYYKAKEGNRIREGLQKQDPSQFKKYAEILKKHGVTNIQYHHAGNFDDHLKDNKLDPSKIMETTSHRGYLHNGNLYLTRKTPALPKQNSQVATLNAALQMFKPKSQDYSHYDSMVPKLKIAIQKYGKKGTPEEVQAVYKQMHPNRPIPSISKVNSIPTLPKGPPPLPLIPRKTPPPLPT